MPNSLVDHLVERKVPIRKSRGKDMWQASFVDVLWLVWKERNLRCFEGKARRIEDLAESLKMFALLSGNLSRPDFA